MAFYRDTWVEVDLDAIIHNVQTIKKTHPSKALFAVVKANGYGHGDVEVAVAALEAGANYLAVSGLDEALRLRRANISAPILVLGMTRISDIEIAIKENITLTAHDEAWIEEVIQLELSAPVMVHLKVDSGMHRLGIENKDSILKHTQMLKDAQNIVLEGIFTHMATADSDADYLQQQIQAFEDVISSIDLAGIKYIHLSNTATLFQHEFSFDHGIRLGLGMYGVNPDADYIPLNFELKPALSLYSTLVTVKHISKGMKVGYGATYSSEADEWIGVVPIGYADGWIRAHQGRNVYVEGYACEIIGRVCMDQLMIRLPYKMEVGTRVTLIGEEMPVEVVGRELKTISYEVLCTISDRVPRVYVRNGEYIGYRKMRFDHDPVQFVKLRK